MCLCDAGTNIYKYHKNMARLVYWSTAALGAVLKSKCNHTTSPFLRIDYMVIYYNNLLGMYMEAQSGNKVHGQSGLRVPRSPG